MEINKLVDIELKGKRVLIRMDFNVPIDQGRITSSTRIDASLATIELARDAGARIMLMSHFGRPSEGSPDPDFSLAPIMQYLSSKLDQPVALNTGYLNTPPSLGNGQVELLENVRFNVGEVKNDTKLGKTYANLCDIFVMDAFGAAHRAQASTHSVGVHADIACAGPLLISELEALEKSLENPRRPMVAIVGGSKISTKLTVLESLVNTVDQLILGGGIANTFIAAAGYPVGKSLYEADLVNQAETLIQVAKQRGVEIPIPTDVVTGDKFSKDASWQIKSIGQVDDNDLIFDIGPETTKEYGKLINAAKTVVWNGPVGVFEFDQFSSGTRGVGKAIANSTAFSIAGGGDTLAAIEKFGLENEISYISTGGGAFLEFLEGNVLPAVEILQPKLT